ncbi:hypothetical protein PYCCODRAFT_54851 [Trametes coccinea BRFM310]|uniref:Uncharacterized protein n=1 Tax=Trametes coccinea (strain BRFM310) TaxID=1353009 RepID=A0A1Y2J7H7_TRAC3|nr:hypothetical protein PYCCODRAFT_54851 [Trametes coccinea BRFM310]
MTRLPRNARLCIPLPAHPLPTASTYLIPSAPLSGKTRNIICKISHLGVIALVSRRAASDIVTFHTAKRDLYIAISHIAACTNSYAPRIRSLRFRTSEVTARLSIPQICSPHFCTFIAWLACCLAYICPLGCTLCHSLSQHPPRSSLTTLRLVWARESHVVCVYSSSGHHHRILENRNTPREAKQCIVGFRT